MFTTDSHETDNFERRQCQMTITIPKEDYPKAIAAAGTITLRIGERSLHLGGVAARKIWVKKL